MPNRGSTVTAELESLYLKCHRLVNDFQNVEGARAFEIVDFELSNEEPLLVAELGGRKL